MSEHETEKEMPGVGGVGRDVLGTIAALNEQAKEMRKKVKGLNKENNRQKKHLWRR